MSATTTPEWPTFNGVTGIAGVGTRAMIEPALEWVKSLRPMECGSATVDNSKLYEFQAYRWRNNDFVPLRTFDAVAVAAGVNVFP